MTYYIEFVALRFQLWSELILRLRGWSLWTLPVTASRTFISEPIRA